MAAKNYIQCVVCLAEAPHAHIAYEQGWRPNDENDWYCPKCKQGHVKPDKKYGKPWKKSESWGT